MKRAILRVIISMILLFLQSGCALAAKKIPMQTPSDMAYCWTPDGKIAFYRRIDHWIKYEPDPFPGGGGVYEDYKKDDEAFIVVRDPETKEEKVLFKIPYGHTATAVHWMDWSGVNNEILMTVFGAGIYGIKSNGEELRLIAWEDLPIGGFKQAQWTPDGKSIMCIASKICPPPMKAEECIGVYIMDADGKNSRAIVLDADAFSISPDGKQVAYQTITRKTTREERKTKPDLINIFYTSDIYIINTDGTDKRLLVDGGQNPRWSPDGKWIMFGILGEAYLISPTEDKKCKVSGYGLLSKDGKSILSKSGHIGQLRVIDETYGVTLKSRREENGYVWWLNIVREGMDK